MHKLRRVLSGLDSHQAIDLLMSQLRKTKTNYEFLVQVSKTTPGGAEWTPTRSRERPSPPGRPCRPGMT